MEGQDDENYLASSGVSGLTHTHQSSRKYFNNALCLILKTFSNLPASRTVMRELTEAREPKDQKADQPGSTATAEDGKYPA